MTACVRLRERFLRTTAVLCPTVYFFMATFLSQLVPLYPHHPPNRPPAPLIPSPRAPASAWMARC